MERPTCGTCPYWESEGQSADIDDSDVGYCHRFPVTPASLIRVEGTENYSVRCQEPQTYDFDWCGEHPDFPAWIEHRRQETAKETSRA